MDEKVLQRRPSDVFLALVQERAADDSFDYFSQLVEVWQQIRELEAIATREGFLRVLTDDGIPPIRRFAPPSPEGKALRPDEDLRACVGLNVDAMIPENAAQLFGGKSTPKSTPEDVEKVHVDGVEKVRPEGVENAPDQSGDPVQNGPAKKRDEADIGRRSLATRKRKIYEAVDRLRAEGTPMQTIADAAPGLTISDVMDAVERKPLALPRLGLLEKAVRKLED